MGSMVYHDQDGVRRTLLWDNDHPNQFHTKTEIDIEQLIDNNQILQDTYKQGKDNKLLARIPMTIYEQSIHEEWTEEQWARWLNDPQNKPFRIWQGRV